MADRLTHPLKVTLPTSGKTPFSYDLGHFKIQLDNENLMSFIGDILRCISSGHDIELILKSTPRLENQEK